SSVQQIHLQRNMEMVEYILVTDQYQEERCVAGAVGVGRVRRGLFVLISTMHPLLRFPLLAFVVAVILNLEI
ncbi:MAG: hypothetical protein ACOCP4_05395, partial [Candidatus Woesearchaeota archaeon]